MIAASPIGKFTRNDFKESLRVLFEEISEQKRIKLEARLYNRLRLVKKMNSRGIAYDQINESTRIEIAETKSIIQKLRDRTPESIFEDAMQWLGIDALTLTQLKLRLTTEVKVIDHKILKLKRRKSKKHIVKIGSSAKLE